MRRKLMTGALLALLAVLSPLADEKDPAKAASLAREGEALYRQGAYSAALKKFEAAFAAGHAEPATLYQAANCYRAALSDETREVELKKKALPLFERQIASGQGGIAPYYYLAATYIHSLADPVKGVEVARRAEALITGRDTSLENPVENSYRAARLYEFLGKDDQAAALDRRFLDIAETSPRPVERAAVRNAREKLAAYLDRKGMYEEAAGIYEALVKAEPIRDADRHRWGLALLRAGRPAEAAAAWRGASSDEYRTELAYLEKVAQRFDQVGRPRSSQKVPDVAGLDDGALAVKVVEAGAALRVFKQAAENARKAEVEEITATKRREREEFLSLSPEERKARWEEHKRKAKKEKPASQKRPASAQSEQGSAGTRLEHTQLPLPPPKSPEWQAAEREFFYLLTELVKRGQLIRMYSFQNGIADLIFR